ncbi:type IV secretion system protein [Arthrobacter alpinus]|nr:type IV secretion system protein [Arthrobacter alpinus]
MLPMVECSAGGWWPPGCGIVSQANDDFAASVTSYVAGILESMASWMWSFISGAFGVSDIDTSEWGIVSGLTNWWVVVMMTPLVVVMIVQLIGGLVSQQPRRIGRALLGGALAVPLVFLATSLMSKLSSFTDSASTALLETLGKDPYLVFMRLFGFQRASAGSGREWDVVSLSSGTAGGLGGAVVVTAIAVLVVWILAFILMCSMIFRSFALIVLAAVAPVAIMLLPWERTKSWTRIWCETVVALLIAKPLAATVLAVAVKLFANSTSFSGLASGAVGMVLACGAPLMALKLVSFAGGEIAGAAQMAGGGHVFSRAGNFTGRQLGRQFGGKMHLPGVGSKGPTPLRPAPLDSTASTSCDTWRPTVDGEPEACADIARSHPQSASAVIQGVAHAAWSGCKGGGEDPGKGPETPGDTGHSHPTPTGTGRAPTTSRYQGKSQSDTGNAGVKPPRNPTSNAAVSPAAAPVKRPAPTAGPKPQPPSSTPVSSPRPVDQSKRPPSSTYRNGDEGHD